jgi:hypothetical protein
MVDTCYANSKPENLKKMKRYLLQIARRMGISALLMVSACLALGQTAVTVNDSLVTDYKNDPWNSPNFQWEAATRQIVPFGPGTTSRVTASSDAESRGKLNVWLEHGDGGFSMQGANTRTIGEVSYPILLRAIPLYDTSKGKDETIIRSMIGNRLGTGPARTGDNDGASLFSAEQGIKITPSNGFVLQGEPLDMAITYKLPLQSVRGTQYYAVLYYNNTAFFDPLVPAGTSTFQYSVNPSQTIANVRYFEGRQTIAETSPAIAKDKVPEGGLANFAMRLIPGSADTGNTDRNFFVTLNTQKNLSQLKVGATTTITVLLARVVGNKVEVIASDAITQQYRLSSFDPNHLTQSPACLLLPKRAQPLSYRLQFQNLGKGPADTVRIVFKRPDALANAAYTLQSFNFGGKTLPADAALFTFYHSYNASQNEDTFVLAPKWSPANEPLHTLKGTAEVANAITHPATMGEINFTLMAPANTGDVIAAQANIYFHSQFAANPAVLNGQWEKPVATNKAQSTYVSKDCQCNNTCTDGACRIILGLCWWWWALILLVLLLLLWWLRRRR